MAWLRLATDRIRKRVDERFRGSVAALASSMRVEPPPHRSTVGRWIDNLTSPKSADLALALAGALDLDPVLLWDFDPASVERLCKQIDQAIRRDNWEKLLPALRYFADLAGQNAEWPPSRIAREFYDRLWSVEAFEHRPDSDFTPHFARLRLIQEGGGKDSSPQVWHFAYRDIGSKLPALWSPYGFVETDGERIRILSYRGELETVARSGRERAVAVETWLGPGSAEFRIASLHEFKLQVGADRRKQACVRFGFPSESPRDCRRLHFLRGWGHEHIKTIFARSSRAGCSDGARARERA